MIVIPIPSLFEWPVVLSATPWSQEMVSPKLYDQAAIFTRDLHLFVKQGLYGQRIRTGRESL